jgi:phosphatidylglycerol:prolipoprotein diacylglycerol transferase
VVLGRLLAVRLAERDGLDPGLMHRCYVWSLVAALAGARLLYVVTNLGQFDGVLDVFAWWKGGAAAYGGFLGGFLGTLVFCRIHRVSVLAWADCAVPALGLGLLLTRVGCFLGGCDFGQPWDGAWAVRFPAGSPAWEQHVLQGLLAPDAPRSLAVHPTQLYESLAGLVLLALAMAVRRVRRSPGQAFASVVAAYAVVRYVIETLRADADRGTVGSLSTSQFIAVATLISAAALAYALQRGRDGLPAGAGPTRARRS